MLTSQQGYLIFVLYGMFFITLVYMLRERQASMDDFLLMRRKLGVVNGSLSIAVSWVWAPAVFICSLQAFTKGLPGIFWFTVPNILCFFVFVPIALKLRETLPKGYTVSEIFKFKFPETHLPHSASLLVTFGYQLGAIIINCVAGATLISLLSGIPYTMGVLMMAGVALAYSLISGLRASVLSDVIQMAMILGIAFMIVPWVTVESGGLDTILTGIGGVTGEYDSVFNLQVAYTFGIAMTIGLISGPVADQMFSQRAFAAKKDAIKKIFIFGGLLFGLVPITLSLLGFIGAAESQTGNISVSDPQMVGPEVINHFLPKWALILFSLMAFSGLTSTLDSALCAIGSLTTNDIKPRFNGLKSMDPVLVARLGMTAFAIIGVGIALLQPKLLWVFLVYGALASSIFIPIILALFWNGLSAKGAFMGIAGGIAIGTPLSIYANVTENTDLIVASAIIGLGLAGVLAWLFSVLGTRNAEGHMA
uniref:Na+/proline symporter n=1 Tax=Candidatus Kentrum sp. LFY TaxID=2126342 RepID=A0A450U7P7_9GAMM|nr:MAG: Na+/proline symporter [Candidatus Kentron sp. LFY]